MNAEIIALVTRHCTTIRDEFAELDRLFEQFQLNALADGAGSVTAIAHKIKGSSGTLGFGAVSARAAVYEKALRALGTRMPNAEEFVELRHLHAALGDEVAVIEPEQSTLYQRFSTAS